MSEKIDLLGAALAKTQKEMENIPKRGKNPHFGNTYALMEDVVATCRKKLADNGLSIVQGGEGDTLETMILHSSGQWISSALKLNPTKNDPQGLMGAVTYCRRYGYLGMTGNASEDDDGQTAVAETKSNANFPSSSVHKGGPSEKQLKRLYAISKTSNWGPAAVKDFMWANFKKSSSQELTPLEYETLCFHMEKHPNSPEDTYAAEH